LTEKDLSFREFLRVVASKIPELRTSFKTLFKNRIFQAFTELFLWWSFGVTCYLIDYGLVSLAVLVLFLFFGAFRFYYRCWQGEEEDDC